MKSILKILASLLLLVATSANISAQKDAEKEYFDLLMMYLDGDFEKMLKKADKYMDSDKTGKDPLPYLYASMAYFDISKNEELAQDYKNPLRESLKLASKFVRYDREKKYADEGDEFLAKLRAEVKQAALAEIADDKGSRADYYFKQLLRLDENDYSIIYMQMQQAIREGDTYSSNELRQQFNQMTALVSEWIKEPQDKLDFLAYSMLQHAEFLFEKGRSDAANKVLAELAQYVGNENQQLKEFKIQRGL